MKITTSSKSGFTLVEIMLVVAIIGLLAGIAIPAFAKARTTSQKTSCISNLRQIDNAKQQWALEHNKLISATPDQSDLDGYLCRVGTADRITCPAGGKGSKFSDTYSINEVGANPTCNILGAAHSL